MVTSMSHAICVSILRGLDLRYAKTLSVVPEVGGAEWGEEARTRTAYCGVCKEKKNLVLKFGFYQGSLTMSKCSY